MRKLTYRSAASFLIFVTACGYGVFRSNLFAQSQGGSDSDGFMTYHNGDDWDALQCPSLSPGRAIHRVGFRQAFLDDDSRPFGERTSRPIRISVWYPAVPRSESPLNLDSYVNLHQNKNASDGVPSFREWAGRMKTEESHIDSILARTNAAYHDAAPASGRFPLIVYAASFRGPAYENFAMFEYLAGQGFIIISIPSLGKDATGMTMDKIGVESQYQDLRLAYRLALELPYVDRDRVGTMGFSLGAVPAALLALREGGIRACASIDGGMCYTYALLGDALETAEARLKAAYLQLTQRPVKSMPLDNRFYGSNAVSNAYHLQWKKLDHYDFASTTLILRSARPKDYQASAQEIELHGVNDTPYTERFEMYRQLVRIIGLFFDAHLRDSTESKNALQTVVKSKLPEYDEMLSIRTSK